MKELRKGFRGVKRSRKKGQGTRRGCNNNVGTRALDSGKEKTHARVEQGRKKAKGIGKGEK